MSGSPGNTSEGTKGGRSPRTQNADITERHHEQGADRHATGTDASTAARHTQTGRDDAVANDPDRPDAE